MTVSERIHHKLTQAFSPQEIDVIDESHLHVGHAGHDGRGESHFRVTVVAAAFDGVSRLERQRRIYAVLAEELADRVHALSIKAMAPGENTG